MSRINQASPRNDTAGIPTGENRIQCEVKNCSYHTANDCCSAKTVHVQSCTSGDRCCSCDETACSTFVEKQ